ncbi:PAS domain S-box protein [Synechocystis salina LEGE 06099]|uniref:PAS domain-containing sensor histidine kinase n=1 Tax=Synechocystis salina TaxID=945780 RepID=UPI00187FCC8F|nr:PAS domain S-box protein [Synechocystis salina]MBE9202345.1 PAS domain S-box protein [Synechocystis salina LEGE 06099]
MAITAFTLGDFFSANGYMPHGHCYLWQTPLVWLHVTADFFTAIAYYSIPVILLYFLRKRQDMPFPNIIFLFGAFILCCGTSHFFDIITLWYPIYWVSGVVKASMAIVSIITVSELIKIVPNALDLKSPTELATLNLALNQEIKERQTAEIALQELNNNLEKRVEDRTTQLAKINQQLEQEIQDKTKAKEALEKNKDQLAQLAAIVESSQDAIISKTLDGIITSWNESAERLFGYTAKEMIGTHISRLIPDGLILEEELISECIRQGQRINTYETQRQRKDGSKIDVALTISPIRDEHGNIVGASKIARDITTRLEVENALRESQYFIEKVANYSPQILYILDPIAWKNIYVNYQSLEILGYTPEEFKNGGTDLLLNILHPDDLPTLYNNKDFWEKAGDGQVLATEYRMRHKNGSWRWLRSREVVFARDDYGQVTKVLGTAQDISDSKKQEQKLYEQGRRELLLRQITQRIRQSLDLPTIFETVVQEIRQFLGADRVVIFQFASAANFAIGDIVAESVLPPFQSLLNQTVEETCFSSNYAHKYQQGRIQAIEDIYQSDLRQCHIDFLAGLQVRANLVLPLINDAVLWGLLCIHQCDQTRLWEPTEIDLLKQITNQFEIAIQQAILYEQAQQELASKNHLFVQLTNELQQKKVLLKEIHHRVKNNLQIMSSLLYLQFSKASPMVQKLSEEYQNRIQSMALIHEQLYRSEDLANIDFNEYLKNLTHNICQSYGFHRGDINIKLLVEQVKVPLEQSIPLGLIIQELVSNALKHAFPTAIGEITIQFTSVENHYSLQVQDNGVGVSKEIDLENTDSLGMQLIYSLTEQLQGELDYQYVDGAKFALQFSI